MSILEKINKLYSLPNATIDTFEIQHDPFTNFYTSYRKISKKLRELIQEDIHLNNFLVKLRRYRNALVTTPLPFNDQSLRNDDLILQLKKEIVRWKGLYDEYIQDGENTLQQCELVLNDNTNPYLEKIRRLDMQRNSCIVVRSWNNRFVNAIEKVLLQNNLHCSVVTESELLDLNIYGDLIICGHPGWYDPRIMQSQRYQSIKIIKYACVNGRMPEIIEFADEWNSMPTVISNLKSFKGIEFTQEDEEEIGLIIQGLRNKYSSYDTEEGDGQDSYPARLAMLEGGKHVFLCDYEPVDSSQNIIFKDDEGKAVVERKKVSEMIPGDAVLLRIQGSEFEARVKHANKILDETENVSSSKLREFQVEWKRKLREKISKISIDDVLIHLNALNCKTANSGTLNNWKSEDNIRPANISDFKILLKFLGYTSSQLKEISSGMQLIYRARIKAAMEITHELYNTITNSDLSQLKKLGVQEFSLSGGGQVAAYVIQFIDSEKQRIKKRLLDKPLDNDED